jgi:TonB family protein
MRSPGLVLIAATLLVVASSLETFPQDQAPKAGPQPVSLEKVAGEIVSLDESCTSFVVAPDGGKKRATMVLTRKPDKVNWSREREGCSFASLDNHNVHLQRRTWVSVRFAAQGQDNLIRWIVVRPGAFSDKCMGQGGAEPDADTIYATGCDGIPDPKCRHCPVPNYSREARGNHIQGRVVVSTLILPDGRTSDVTVLRGIDQDLDRNALEAIRNWRFEPVIGPEGTPITVELHIDVDFRFL